jgi:hypothetical protein
MKNVSFCVLAVLFAPLVRAQDRDARIAELDKKLNAARQTASDLQKTIDGLATELAGLRETKSPFVQPQKAKPAEDSAHNFREQILRPELGGNERDSEISAKPELFIQSRYQALPQSGTDTSSAPSNFLLTRMESRWAGRLSDKIGMGFELQYHPAPAGASEELVNDAFLEYYLSKNVTVRGGQFVKPFGFDIQQSSSTRESPERGMFAGYFFPGQRDRGVMIVAKLDDLDSAFEGVELFAGAFNGNRFFADNNRQLNYNLRLRKTFTGVPLAVGVSAQLGRQILPPDTSGTTRENIYGADVQWAWRRIGLRAEFMSGNMPSTLLGLEPKFAPQFRPGAHSTGGALFGAFRLWRDDQFYARYDQFNGEPVKGLNVRALNLGYGHKIGEHARLSFNYQLKNRPSFNDDLVNTKFQVVWNVVY